jgi:hypothetical protein
MVVKKLQFKMKTLIILLSSLLIGCQLDEPINRLSEPIDKTESIDNRLSEPISFIKDVPSIFESGYDRNITYTLTLINDTTLYIKYEYIDKTYIESFFVKFINDSILDDRFILENERFYVYNPELDDYDIYFLYK